MTTGPKMVARDLGLPAATVAQVLRRHGLSRLRDLEPRPWVERYEHARPGDLVHLDVKKLGLSTVTEKSPPTVIESSPPFGDQLTVSAAAWTSPALSLSLSR